VIDGNEDPLAPLRTAQQAARYLGCSLPTLYRLLRSLQLKGCKVRGRWRVSDEALRDYLEQAIHIPQLTRNKLQRTSVARNQKRSLRSRAPRQKGRSTT
jgi:excisionase family DNA binding protein